MKTFSVVVALAVVLTFICLQQSSAVLITEVQELEEPKSNDDLIAAHEETVEDSAEESWKMPYNNRPKRGNSCRFCCNCCSAGVCGLCCRF